MTGSLGLDQLRDNLHGCSIPMQLSWVSMGRVKSRATANFSKELGRATIPSTELLVTFAAVGKSTGMSLENVGILAAKLSEGRNTQQAQWRVTMQSIVDSTGHRWD